MQSRSIPVLLAAGLLPCFGCGRRREDARLNARWNSLSSEASAPTAEAELQAALDRLRSLPHQWDPAQRLPVFGKGAKNNRDWVLQTLLAGYAQSRHTSRAWDASARAAFEAYSDFVQGSQPGRYPDLLKDLTNGFTAGCTDPMIHYMEARHGYFPERRADMSCALRYAEAHDKMFLPDDATGVGPRARACPECRPGSTGQWL